MESCIRISLSEYIDPDQSQRFDHSGRNEIWREPFPPARTCDNRTPGKRSPAHHLPYNALLSRNSRILIIKTIEGVFCSVSDDVHKRTFSRVRSLLLSKRFLHISNLSRPKRFQMPVTCRS